MDTRDDHDHNLTGKTTKQALLYRMQSRKKAGRIISQMRRRCRTMVIFYLAFLVLIMVMAETSSISASSTGRVANTGKGSWYKMTVKHPIERQFLKFPLQDIPKGGSIASTELKVLQLNILADGLSGLRDDKGFFSRVSREDILWENRKDGLLKEVLQYNPDIITLQENDHYYDFFLPELNAAGYDCFFAPKPASACLEVSDRSDGCSIFTRRSKLKVVSSQTITYVLATKEKNDNELMPIQRYAQVTEQRRKQLRAQNQVAMINVCELQDIFTGNAPSIVIGTTHLKATKNEEGERFRQREAAQFLDAVDKICKEIEKSEGRAPAVILTGDLNSTPPLQGKEYPSLAYETFKEHPLGLRSVLNDDVGLSGSEKADEVYTTWKARIKKKGKEAVVKHCIDFIFYAPFRGRRKGGIDQLASSMSQWPAFIKEKGAAKTTRDTSNDGQLIPESDTPQSGFRAKEVLDLYDEDEVGPGLLPSERYPSDHLAIAANLQLLWYTNPKGDGKYVSTQDRNEES